MTTIHDNFIFKKDFLNLQKYCNTNEFQVIQAGEKQFLALESPPNIVSQLWIPGHEVILSFIRKAHKDFDTDYRIHADGIIMGRKTALASVLYINNEEGVTPNGTKFYKHVKHGQKLPGNISNEEFDTLLLEDSNNLDQFIPTDFVANVPNRLLTYNANYFHSKWPKSIDQGERIVLVTFYTSQL